MRALRLCRVKQPLNRRKTILNKHDFVQALLKNKPVSIQDQGHAYAPANIALCKYWGKRNEELNLPLTSSLSISLNDKGADTKIMPADADSYISDGEPVNPSSSFGARLESYLDLFRTPDCPHFYVETTNTIPVAAGLASSASGYAALALALNELMQWNLSNKECSMLARLGSGSASRSVYQGFVEWHAGADANGLDSFAEPLDIHWPEFRVGILTISTAKKPISSREAMRQTVKTSTLFEKWPDQVEQDLADIKQALFVKDFSSLGATTEHNALSMHATMFATKPPICYWQPETLTTLHQLWALRAEGLPLYATMDAGPNVKILFLKQETSSVLEYFPAIDIISPFS